MVVFGVFNRHNKSFGTLVQVIGPSWPELQYIERAARARARGRKLLWIQEQIFKRPSQERPTVYQMAAMGLSGGHKRFGPRLNLGVDLY